MEEHLAVRLFGWVCDSELFLRQRLGNIILIAERARAFKSNRQQATSQQTQPKVMSRS